MKTVPWDKWFFRERARLRRIAQVDRVTAEEREKSESGNFGFDSFSLNPYQRRLYQTYAKYQTNVRKEPGFRETVLSETELSERIGDRIAHIDSLIWKAAYNAIDWQTKKEFTDSSSNWNGCDHTKITPIKILSVPFQK